MNVDALSLRELRIEIAERLGWRWMRRAGDHLAMLVPPGAYQLGSTKDGKPWLVPSTAGAERYKDWDTLIWTGAISERLPNWPESDAAALELFTTAAAGDWYVYLDNDAGYERRGARTGSPSFWNCCIGGACHLGAKTLAEAISRAWLKWKVSE